MMTAIDTLPFARMRFYSFDTGGVYERIQCTGHEWERQNLDCSVRTADKASLPATSISTKKLCQLVCVCSISQRDAPFRTSKIITTTPTTGTVKCKKRRQVARRAAGADEARSRRRRGTQPVLSTRESLGLGSTHRVCRVRSSVVRSGSCRSPRFPAVPSRLRPVEPICARRRPSWQPWTPCRNQWPGLERWR